MATKNKLPDCRKTHKIPGYSNWKVSIDNIQLELSTGVRKNQKRIGRMEKFTYISLWPSKPIYRRMNSFAKILYPLQTIPTLIPTKEIDKLNTSLREFLWKGQKPKIALTKLWMHKKEGGINLLNLHLYNLTCLLRHASDWITGQGKYTNTNIEQVMSAPWDLKALLHVPPKQLPLEIKNNLLIRDTVVAWQTTRQKEGRSISMSRYSPIQNNPQFIPGTGNKIFDQ